MKVLVLHGPNLNALGRRQVEVYGTSTLEEIDVLIRAEAKVLNLHVETRQTSLEGEVVSWLHEAAGTADGIVINPAAYAHTSRAIADAIRSIDIPVVEVHLSNIHAREPWRRQSVTAEAAAGIVSGFGPHSYILGLRALVELVSGDEQRAAVHLEDR